MGSDAGGSQRGGEVRWARAADHGAGETGGTVGLRGAPSAGGPLHVLRLHAVLSAVGHRWCVCMLVWFGLVGGLGESML